MQARFLRLAERIASVGLESLSEPHVKHLEGKRWELRLTGRDGIARALYVTALVRRVVVVRAFVKKTQKTPRSEIELASRACPRLNWRPRWAPASQPLPGWKMVRPFRAPRRCYATPKRLAANSTCGFPRPDVDCRGAFSWQKALRLKWRQSALWIGPRQYVRLFPNWLKSQSHEGE